MPASSSASSSRRPRARRTDARRGPRVARLLADEHHSAAPRPPRTPSGSPSARAGTPGIRPRLRAARRATAAPAGTPRRCRCRRSTASPVTYRRAPLLHRFVDSPIDMVSSMSENGRLRALAELAVKVGANVEEGQYVLVTGARRARAARARDRERLLRERRALRRRDLRRPARAARDDREGPGRDARVEPGVGRQAHGGPRRGARRDDLDHRRSRAASCSATSIRTASAARGR